MSDEIEELRMFSFTNWMLRSIQQGIQPGHAAVEMFVKYHPILGTSRQGPLAEEMLYNWADMHKTFICKNGGDHTGIETIAATFESKGNMFPWAPFYEDQSSLGGLITSVAIVVPARIFDDGVDWAKQSYRGNMLVSKPDPDTGELHFTKEHNGEYVGSLTPFEFELAMLLRDTQLAT